MDFFRRKVFLALVGLVIIGGTVGGVVYATSLPHSAAANGTSQAMLTTSTSATASPPKATGTPTTPPPTAPPVPTSTPAVPTLRGIVSSIRTNAFLLQGNATIIDVTAQTAFTGSITTMSALKPGDFARVHGMYQSDGSFLAASVDAQPNNDN